MKAPIQLQTIIILPVRTVTVKKPDKGSANQRQVHG